MSTHEEIFDEIVKVGKAAGMNPSQLAAACDCTAQRLFNWRRRGVPAEKVRALSEALGGRLLPHQIRPDLPGIFPPPSESTAAAAAYLPEAA